MIYIPTTTNRGGYVAPAPRVIPGDEVVAPETAPPPAPQPRDPDRETLEEKFDRYQLILQGRLYDLGDGARPDGRATWRDRFALEL